MAIKSIEGVGASVPRLTSERLVKGGGTFIADIDLPGVLAYQLLIRGCRPQIEIDRIGWMLAVAAVSSGTAPLKYGENVAAKGRWAQRPRWGGL